MDPALAALAIVLAFVLGVISGAWAVLRMVGAD